MWGIGKRGAEDSVAPWLIGIGILILGAILIGYFYWIGPYKALKSTLPNLGTEALSSARTVCSVLSDTASKGSGLVTNAARIEFCQTPKFVFDDAWATCDFLVMGNYVSLPNRVSCTNLGIPDASKKSFCKQEVVRAKKDIELNGVKCVRGGIISGCSDLGGVDKPSTASCASGTKELKVSGLTCCI